MKTACFAALLLLLVSLGGNLRADPVLGPAVEQNGLRFESWLASSQIIIPNESVDYGSTARVLFSVRVTNLTQTRVRLNPFAARLKIVKTDGEEFGCGFGIAGCVREPQESDFILIQPGQSLILPYLSHLYWIDNNLALDWPSPVIDHPWNYGGVTAGSYRFSLCYKMLNPAVAIRDDGTHPIVKTLNGFWTGDVTTPPLKFELVPTPAQHWLPGGQAPAPPATGWATQ